jgi:hypothetical protein
LKEPAKSNKNMLIPTFKDEALEKEMNENGFVVIPRFLKKEGIDHLMSIYQANKPEGALSFWNSHNDLPHVSGLEISDQIRSMMEPGLDKLFNDWMFPFAQFIVLNPTGEHKFRIHRDDTIFDEEKVQYRQLWMPLVDLTTTNGALYIVPKSHKLFTDKMPSMIQWPYEYLIPSLEPEYRTIYAKAGDLIIWTDKTLHGSTENISDQGRPVCQGGIIHRDARPLFCRYRPEHDDVETYQVDTLFFRDKEYLNPGAFAKYPLLKTEKYSYKQISDNDVKEFFAQEKK